MVQALQGLEAGSPEIRSEPGYISCLQRLLCRFAPILFTALAVWHCPYPFYSACCVALPLSCLQRLLRGLFLSYVQRLMCGIAPILFTALAAWFCPYPVYSACCVALPLSCLQRLLCGSAPILFTALAVWHACCVALPLYRRKIYAHPGLALNMAVLDS